jgi:hypothetical protein
MLDDCGYGTLRFGQQRLGNEQFRVDIVGPKNRGARLPVRAAMVATDRLAAGSRRPFADRSPAENLG